MKTGTIQMLAQQYLSNHGYNGTHAQNKALRDITACRTGILGATKIVCTDCGHVQYLYKSCGNRNCPTCNSLRQLRWKEARASEYLPVTYYHAVFTVPDSLNPVFMKHPAECYNLLFKAASETLLELAANKKRLNARIGFIGVLHTWGAQLSFHPHLHVILPGCGINGQNNLVIPKNGFFFPVKVISALFRGKFLDGLKKLGFNDTIDYSLLYAKNWVIYLKNTASGSRHVIEYLGRYTHRIAISDCRIVSTTSETVTFCYKDYRDNNKIKEMTLSLDEFMRRFLMHVLPEGFVKIRFFGLLSNRAKAINLAIIRRLLNQTAPENRFANRSATDILAMLYGEKYCSCKNCGSLNLTRSFSPPYRTPE